MECVPCLLARRGQQCALECLCECVCVCARALEFNSHSCLCVCMHVGLAAANLGVTYGTPEQGWVGM